MSDSQSQRSRDVFLELVELSCAERVARLDVLCGDDVALRARVEQLLRADTANREGGSSLDQPLVEVDGARQPIPMRVGAYVISGVAGEGGMGQVFDAIHEPTRRRAAVKLLHAGMAGQRSRERLRLEAESLARLSDPGIAQVYDAGVAEVHYSDDTRVHRPFIAMEFVDGRPIVEFARAHGLPVGARLRLIERVLRAVQHAHQRAVIHRDLKPGNILVSADGAPKIVDFGIARMIDATQDGMTLAGQIVGTVRYMSPEQALGEPGRVDIRSDVYSVGAILYEMLADQPLVPIDSGSSLGAALVFLKRSPTRLASLKPELSGDVEAMVQKAIEREPDDRYASAQAFADDLQACLDGREVSARAPTTIERWVRVVRRNKAKVVAAAVIAFSLVGGIIGTTWGLVRAEQARRAEVRQREAADRSAAEAQHSADQARNAEADAQAFSNFLVNRVLATARPKDTQGGLGLNVTIAEALHNAETSLETDFAGRPAAEAIARRAIGVTWRHRGEFDKAAAHLRRAVELATGALGENDAMTLDLQNSLLVLLQMTGQNQEGVAVQERIVAGLEQTAGPRAFSTIAARHNLASYRARRGGPGDNEAALALLAQVHADRAALLGPDNINTLSTLAVIAEIHQRLGEGDRAIAMLVELRTKFTSLFGEDNPETISLINRLAFVHQQLGHHDVAIPLYERILPKARQAFSDQHPITLGVMRCLATLRLQAGDDAERTGATAQAFALLQEYSIGQSKLLGERSAQTAKMLSELAQLMHAHQHYAAAEDFARRCVSIRQEIAPGSPELLDAERQLRESLEAQGRGDEAASPSATSRPAP